jgi:primase-polymerase (primpol)-like protein
MKQSITDQLLSARAANGGKPLQHPAEPFHLRCRPENIPAFLRSNRRWAPFKLVWNEKRAKYDKVPVRADGVEWNLSTANPARWFPFAEALGAYMKHMDVVHGIGYVMTGVHGVVGVDLDQCSDINGTPEPWAAEILHKALSLGYYVERSPSGKGFRVFYEGQADDWVNNERGLEVYGGNAARFLTVTGHPVEGVSL